jgi:hypothetical protein
MQTSINKGKTRLNKGFFSVPLGLIQGLFGTTVKLGYNEQNQVLGFVQHNLPLKFHAYNEHKVSKSLL